MHTLRMCALLTVAGLRPPRFPACSNLASNGLRSSLPAAWSQLASLERLYLDANQLTGTLPAGWSMLKSVQYM